jgi:hypothetical protein
MARGAAALTALLAVTASSCTGSSPTPEPTATVEHRIGVRRVQDGGQLFDRTTGAAFVLRGLTYPGAPAEARAPEAGVFGPGFDPALIDRDLAQVGALGFNTVRVVIDQCLDECTVDPEGGLRSDTLDAMAEFLRLAAGHGLQVVLSSHDLPDRGGFGDALPCCHPFGGYRNSQYLSPEGVDISIRYFAGIVRGLVARQARLDAVLAYELASEHYLFEDTEPLTLRSGRITTANGITYDLGIAVQRRRMIRQGLLHYIQAVRDAIRAVDPTALVTMGFFAPNRPYPWRTADTRLVDTAGLIRRSALDLVSLHVNPGHALGLYRLRRNFGLRDRAPKPVIMGDVTASRRFFATAEEGALALASWQAASCRLGFDGWEYRLWGDDLWGGLQEGDALGEALAPISLPDPCDVRGLQGANLALGTRPRASAMAEELAPVQAVDGSPGTQWGAGGFPPQWIEIDLGSEVEIGAIRLLPGQRPAGRTVHRIESLSPDGTRELLVELDGETEQGVWIEHEPDAPWAGVSTIRIETVAGPSFVAWQEIEILAA